MLRHKRHLNKFKKIEIILSIFSKYNGIKLEINYKKKSGNITHVWRLNNMLLNNSWVDREIKGEIKGKKIPQRQMEKRIQHTKIYRMHQSCTKREV